MLKNIFALAIIGALASACTVTKTGIPEVDKVVQKAQDATAKACGFVPYVETILAALNALTGGKVPTGAQYTQMATQVCNAVTPAVTSPTMRTLMSAAAPVGTPVIVVKGQTIPVKGYFVR